MSALAAALIAAQADLPTAIGKDSTGQIGTRQYRYLSLDKLIEDTRPILTAHGLSISQWPTFIPRDGEAPYPALSTKLLHEDGEDVTCTMPLYPAGENKMQALGSAITYARRYAWAAVLGIAAEEDDDGAAF